jgi:hydrogenase maturation protease
MPDLFEQLQECLAGRVCLVGIGNVEYGDDGFGVRLAEALLKKFKVQSPKSKVQSSTFNVERSEFNDLLDSGGKEVLDDELRTSALGAHPSVLIAGTAPEQFIGRIVEAGFDHVLFLDAVECGGAPGDAVFLDSRRMAAKYPQISTHKLALGLLANWVEANGRTRAWLLGVQPESLRSGAGLTPKVQKTFNLLAAWLSETRDSDFSQPAVVRRQSAIV